MTAADIAAARGYLGIRRQRELRRGHPERLPAIDAALLCVEMVFTVVADEEGAEKRRALAAAPTRPLNLPGFETTALAQTKAMELQR